MCYRGASRSCLSESNRRRRSPARLLCDGVLRDSGIRRLAVLNEPDAVPSPRLDYDRQMIRRTLFLSSVLLTVRVLPAPQADIGEFFERFTTEWVRSAPQLATSTQYFSGDEQDKLDRQLTLQTAQYRKERVDRARRALAELRRFDRKRLSDSQRTSARVLEWQLDAIVKGARYDAHSYVFNQGIAGMPG